MSTRFAQQAHQNHGVQPIGVPRGVQADDAAEALHRAQGQEHRQVRGVEQEQLFHDAIGFGVPLTGTQAHPFRFSAA
ncbi:MAG: hypothetical protein IPM46_12600 [Flavobacteriales bacterium]|nr:hypothetical protein [Flavobacteriales bacterium]